MPAKASTKTQPHFVDVPPPEGARVLQDARGFLTFEKPGDTVTGILLGQTTVKRRNGEAESRWEILTDSGEIMILPSHAQLTRQLERLSKTHRSPRIWIAYCGTREANTPSGFIHLYKLAVLEDEVEPPPF